MSLHQAVSRRTALAAGAAAAAAVTVGPAATATAAEPATAAPGHTRPGRPTIVLVHGAFADASSWSPVIERLQGRGHTVIAPANPLRGLHHDAAHIAAVLASVKGPVVLAGHSYGGAVITEAAANAPGVEALVYVAAFMPDAGEVLGELAGRFPGSELTPALTQVPAPAPDGSPGLDLYIRTEEFHRVFAQDVSLTTARTLAAVQRPLSATAFGDRATAAAWRSLPSWALVATRDRGIPAELQRFQARRAGSRTAEVRSSHLPLHSAPDAVAGLIRAAADHVRR
ncbi:alpha/beta fold hydrolase [Streptomyces bikiniensis]|uniref:alpha/beta fold hydrolase n=1 Tax=Streptomyces bikiniensis TaxID=1896 RepID=UPI0004BF5D90|nr:alpha/beta hydrolase [Streptomyces bikiniensis]